MAVITPARRTPRRTPRLHRRAGYLTIRVTGVLLAVLALGHFALTHLVHDVAETGSAFIADRWATALWVAWDAALLGAALLHAAAGLVVILRDHRTQPRSLTRWVAGIAGLCAVLFVIGAATLTYSALDRA